MVVTFMAFLFPAMGAGAGVFGMFTSRTLGKIEAELRGGRLGIRRRLDLHDYGELLAFRNGFVGNELLAIFGESELGRVRTISHGDGDDLSGWRDDFASVIQEPDLDLLVCGDQELGVGLHGVDDAAAVRGFDFLRRIGEGEAGDERGDGDDFGFHLVYWFQWFGVFVGLCGGAFL